MMRMRAFLRIIVRARIRERFFPAARTGCTFMDMKSEYLAFAGTGLMRKPCNLCENKYSAIELVEMNKTSDIGMGGAAEDPCRGVGRLINYFVQKTEMVL